jgi:hydrogenase maturation protease
MPVTPRILLIGCGNPGRGDDGLGPALAARIAALDLPGLTVEIDDQLTVDHAAPIAAHDLVIFADAAVGLDAPFRLTPLGGATPTALGSHQVTPEAALHLARLLYGRAPRGWTLAISGREFGEVREGLGTAARANLSRATAWLSAWLARAAMSSGADRARMTGPPGRSEEPVQEPARGAPGAAAGGAGGGGTARRAAAADLTSGPPPDGPPPDNRTRGRRRGRPPVDDHQ